MTKNTAHDPLDALIAALALDAPENEKLEARAQLSAIVAGKRPWGQLPSRLKQAARNDCRALIAAGHDDLVALGYSVRAVAHMLADLGFDMQGLHNG